MKTLTDDEIIYILDNLCNFTYEEKCINCPLQKECLHYFTGEDCGSALENNNREEQNLPNE